MRVIEKGIMTLSLLLILSALLLILLFLDDGILKTHRSIIALRKNYLEHSLVLQNASQQNILHLCNTLSLDNNQKTHKIILENTLKNDRTNDNISTAIWCDRHFLFKELPKKSTYQKEFKNYIDSEQLQIFKEKLVIPKNNLPKSKTATLYWFPKDHSQWEINNDLYGVVIAEDDLLISGKGKIRGTVITGGNLTLIEGVTVAYKKSVINSVVKEYSQWQLSSKSWYDFNDEL
ncbi:uncharacterized protein DUF2572 [Bisgaardia hudsonensis]|uniref:Uncharacterized protein DUF2572 n=1 Tax=Bisgaardia hudsonensis TaxID=109472 RepID=A0A4R2N286_9PAST|nr:DUF2572 family protein [Bisgaardia hudsonensis]QLB12449.1 hypothetical protein A6A11_01920 [Bisgaardia hudsonensis]TCP13984.1 uncharacterized protein DUF2572 [Bisgaardia hudsonensis]